ncbi:MAG: sugar-binding domain-containing protein, partial [Verrucomicrobiota bacterium]|nr:sugar-binding domain-containing protein [Verrucomicrobiota bacterium]
MILHNRILCLSLALAAAHAQDPADLPRLKPRPVDYGVLRASSPHWPELIKRHDSGSRNADWARKDFDHQEWETMQLPSHWEEAGLPDYDGIVWFRRTVEVSATMAGGGAILELGAIDDMDVTWVNGKRVGGYEEPGHHFTPRTYRLAPGILVPGKNTLAIRVFDHGHGGGLAQTHGNLQLTGSGEKILLRGDWHYRAGASLEELLSPGPSNPAPDTKEPFGGRFSLRPHDV